MDPKHSIIKGLSYSYTGDKLYNKDLPESDFTKAFLPEPNQTLVILETNFTTNIYQRLTLLKHS